VMRAERGHSSIWFLHILLIRVQVFNRNVANADAGFVTAQRAKAMAEAKHPKNWKALGHANPMRDIFVEKLVSSIHIA
jgi:hypothetical protein